MKLGQLASVPISSVPEITSLATSDRLQIEFEIGDNFVNFSSSVARYRRFQLVGLENDVDLRDRSKLQ